VRLAKTREVRDEMEEIKAFAHEAREIGYWIR
jgi:hypothetical protein